LALEFDDLRVTHAAWHLGCVAQLHETLSVESSDHPVHDQWRPHVALHAAFERGALRPGIPREPWSEWTMTSCLGLRFQTAIKTASRTSSLASVAFMDHPITMR
jgi:hypothetical protein